MLKNKETIAAAGAAALICLLVYLPALQCGFVTFDDPEYVLNNPVIKEISPASLLAMFSQPHVGWWMPLTWLSLSIDYHFWGANPFGYHLTNIILHAVNAGLVVLIVASLLTGAPPLEETPGRRRWGILILAGLLFGLHPLRVESVAWISERKDVLNGLFSLLSLFFYLRHVRSKDQDRPESQARLSYRLSVVFFVCSLMAKSVSVVLPALFLVLDLVPLQRHKTHSIRQLVVEKWPFWGVAMLSSALTYSFAAQSGYLVSYQAFPFMQRLLVSGNAVYEYLRLFLMPVGLSPFNVIPDPIPTSYMITSLLVGLALGAAIVCKTNDYLKALLACFLLPLLPVLAFFQNGDQAFADRFTYLPSLAPVLFLALVLCKKGPTDLIGRWAPVGLGIFLVVCMGLTVRQIGVWRTPESFWTRVIDVEPLAISYKERGRYYLATGRFDRAAADFTAALTMIPPTLKPLAFNFVAFRGEALREGGQYDAAVRDFTEAIGSYPHPAYFFHRGLALKALGKADDAAHDFRKAGPDPGQIDWFYPESSQR